MGHRQVLQQQRHAGGEHGQVGQARPRVGTERREVRQGLERQAGREAQQARHQELDDGEQRHVAPGRELRRVHHVEAQEQGGQERDQVAEAQREPVRAGERYASHARHAHHGGSEVEARGPRPVERPAEERDDHAVERREERAVRRRGVGEPGGVAPVGQKHHHAQNGALAQVLGVEVLPDAGQHDHAQDDARGREAHAHDPRGRERVHRRLDDDGAEAPDGGSHQQERLVRPKRQRSGCFQDTGHCRCIIPRLPRNGGV